jgi:hypothetical protein
MQAKTDSSDRAREHVGLPLSTDPWESRSGSAWLVGGVCTLALAAFVYFKLDPVAARARDGAGDAEQPAASAERATMQPEAPAPAAAAAAVGDHTGAEPTAPPGVEAQAEPSSPQSAANSAAAGQFDSTLPSAGEQPKPARRSKRPNAELQRLRSALTLAANLDSSGVPETVPVVEAPASAPVPAPARMSAIPDNPY